MSVERRGPLGGAQEYEWWKMQDPKLRSSDTSNVPVRLLPPRPIDEATARAAVLRLLERNEALRTTIELGPDNVPSQVVHAAAALEFDFLDDPTPHDHLYYCLDRAQAELDPSVFPAVTAAAIRHDGAVTEVLLVVAHCFVDGRSTTLLAAQFVDIINGLTGHADTDISGPQAQAQPLDCPDIERASTTTFWEQAAAIMPTSMFTPSREGLFDRHGAAYTTDRLPALLALVARRRATTPAVVYLATIHALLAAMSGGPRSVVRNHFAGRTKEQNDVVGCFHRILPIVVDVEDRPDLATLIGRVAGQSLRAHARAQTGFLQLREILALEERSRGALFAEGATVNFAFDDAYAQAAKAPEEELVTAIGESAGELELLMGRNETTADYRGFAGYLMVRIEDGVAKIQSSFNRYVFTPRQMRALLTGPEELLFALLDGEVTWPDVERLAGVEGPGRLRHAPTLPSESEPVPALATSAAAVAALTTAVEQANAIAPVDPDRSYLEAGGRLLMVSAVLAFLRERGHEGLGAYDFTLPVSLRTLAARLVSAEYEGWLAKIAELWQTELRLDTVGPDDDFFDLGGDSLTLAAVHGGLIEATGRDVAIVTLFEHPTPRSLAARLSSQA
ncbi:condensation domain-containing protein [Actinospica robiniae]|uniref:condensation domain-containing protein n=1 Tax=Actinospica robiniae TaxID=304901 RepID=UPI000424CBF6|nr:condensation domain-containing protein [Actinospica robiniae]